VRRVTVDLSREQYRLDTPRDPLVRLLNCDDGSRPSDESDSGTSAWFGATGVHPPAYSG